MTKTIISGLVLICSLFAVQTAFAQTQSEKDEKILKEYFTKNKINAKKTPSGLYYVISKKGSGENAKASQTVSMKYIGKFLGGNSFDANVNDAFEYVNGRDALNFTLGVGQVIKGWDEGIQLLNPGSRGTFYIPSGLGYGAADHGPIPANSIMVFDVELLSAGN